jgi:hypothetical protein
MGFVTRNGWTSSVDIYRDEGYVIKRVKGPPWRICLQFEVDALKRIAAVGTKHFPVLLEVKHDHFKMDYCGEPPTKTTIPGNVEEQIVEIVRVLKAANVLNRDIRPGNLLILGAILKVVDFGWATTFIKPSPRPGDAPGLGADYRKGKDLFDDEYSLRKSIEDIRSGAWPKPPTPVKKKK